MKLEYNIIQTANELGKLILQNGYKTPVPTEIVSFADACLDRSLYCDEIFQMTDPRCSESEVIKTFEKFINQILVPELHPIHRFVWLTALYADQACGQNREDYFLLERWIFEIAGGEVEITSGNPDLLTGDYAYSKAGAENLYGGYHGIGDYQGTFDLGVEDLNFENWRIYKGSRFDISSLEPTQLWADWKSKYSTALKDYHPIDQQQLARLLTQVVN